MFGLPLKMRQTYAGDMRDIELAIALYARVALSLGKAAELAELDRIPFGELVGEWGIPRHYGEAELAQDIAYARSQ